MAKNDVVITGFVDPDPKEPDLPRPRLAGAINLASDESVAKQVARSALGQAIVNPDSKPLEAQNTAVPGESRVVEGEKRHTATDHSGSEGSAGGGQSGQSGDDEDSQQGDPTADES